MSGTLLELHDALLCDLDGVVYAGPHAVPHAIEALSAAQERGIRVGYCTNNASRTPEEVAGHLASLGLETRPEQVFSSARAGALLAAHHAQEHGIERPTVLVLGTEALLKEACDAGLRPVESAQDCPDFVLQGFSPETVWHQLAEAGFAIHGGARWIATNTDQTIPRAEGIAPGNGTLVAAVAAATNQQPVVAGKPAPTLMQMAAHTLGASAPLVIGDRLDTDIAGGLAAGFATALVLTGVTDRHGAGSGAEQAPDYVLENLSALDLPAKELRAGVLP